MSVLALPLHFLFPALTLGEEETASKRSFLFIVHCHTFFLGNDILERGTKTVTARRNQESDITSPS